MTPSSPLGSWKRAAVLFGRLGPATLFLLALNTFCWLLFLTREPVNPAEYARVRMLPGGGIQFTGSTATPDVVASRAVARGGFHGKDTAPVEAYRTLNLVALLFGAILYAPGSFVLAFSGLAPESTIPSWFLASCLFAGTSFQWLLIGRLVDRLLDRFSGLGTRVRQRAVLVPCFLAAALGMTVWWWPAERDDYLLQSSFEGKPAPILRALENDPANPELWRRLGRAYRMKDRWAEARPAYRRSLELDPTDFDAWADLRLASICLGDEDGAARAEERLLALDREWALRRLEYPAECCAFEVCPK